MQKTEHNRKTDHKEKWNRTWPLFHREHLHKVTHCKKQNRTRLNWRNFSYFELKRIALQRPATTRTAASWATTESWTPRRYLKRGLLDPEDTEGLKRRKWLTCWRRELQGQRQFPRQDRSDSICCGPSQGRTFCFKKSDQILVGCQYHPQVIGKIQLHKVME